MAMARPLVVALALLLVAGCTAPAAKPEAPESTSEAPRASDCGVRSILLDESIYPVAGARVTVVETGESNVTDENGSYCLHPPAGNYTLAVDDHGKRWTMRCGDEPTRCERQAA